MDVGRRAGVCNPATSRILGLDEAEIRGQPFTATIPNVAGLDEFRDTVLAATYDGAAGARSSVRLRSGDGTASLAVTASYLTASASSTLRPGRNRQLKPRNVGSQIKGAGAV